MRRLVVLLSTIVVGLGALAPVTDVLPVAAASSEPVGSVLPFSYVSAMLGDPVDDLAYIGGQSDARELLVVDASGSVVRRIEDLGFPRALALSVDRGTLYAAKGRQVVRVDLDDESRTSYPLGGACADDLVLLGDQLWFLVCDDPDVDGPLGVLDLTDGSVTLGLGPIKQGYPEQVTGDPRDPSTLYIADRYDIFRLDVTPTEDGTPQARTVVRQPKPYYNEQDLQMSADGAFVLAGGRVHRASDLAPVDFYPNDDDGAVAVSREGVVAVGGRVSDGYDLYTYAPGQTTFAERTDYGYGQENGTERIEPGRIVFGGRTLFVVTSESPDVGRMTLYASRPEPPGDPIGSSRLELTEVGEVVGDRAGRQSFVSTGGQRWHEGNGIVVVDDEGRVTRVLHGLPGVSAMVVDGHTLWAGVTGLNAIAAIDTRTYQVRLYPLPGRDVPLAIAVSEGLVWFSAGPSDSSIVGRYLGALDPASGVVTKALAAEVDHLASSPAFPGQVYGFGGDDRPEWGRTVRYTVTGGDRPSLRVKARRYLGRFVSQAAVVPSGRYLVYAVPLGPLSSSSADSATLQPTKVSHGQLTAESVVVRSDGLVATGFTPYPSSFVDNPSYAVHLRWGATGAPAGTKTIKKGRPVSRGLAFVGRDLLMVTPSGPGSFDVEVLKMPDLRK